MTNLTDCTRYEDDLKAYTDGELSWLRRLAVCRHLTHCACCQKEIREMTQMTEDLRASEPADSLSPSLREKLLEPNPAQVPTLQSNLLQSKEVGSRKRPVLAWGLAAIALIGWFICYPMFQPVRENARMVNASVFRSVQPLPTANSTGNDLPNRPAPPAMPADITEPVPAIPPPPKAVHAVDASTVEEKAAGQTFAMNAPPAAQTVDNGDTDSNPLNGDPDSLRQVHKEAGIGIQVPNPETTGDTLNQMVQETGGYVAANNLSTDSNGLKSGELIVKVPEPQFETFLASVAKLGVVVSKNVTGQDITEKTSDAQEAQSVEESDLTQAEARLKALGSHAKWEDTQNAEDLRVQLAQTRARLKLLKRMAALGTITIDLSQTPKAAAAVPVTGGFLNTLQLTTHDALQSLVGSAGALLALVIWLLAYAPIWLPLLLIGRYALKGYKKREAVSS